MWIVLWIGSWCAFFRHRPLFIKWHRSNVEQDSGQVCLRTICSGLWTRPHNCGLWRFKVSKPPRLSVPWRLWQVFSCWAGSSLNGLIWHGHGMALYEQLMFPWWIHSFCIQELQVKHILLLSWSSNIFYIFWIWTWQYLGTIWPFGVDGHQTYSSKMQNPKVGILR